MKTSTPIKPTMNRLGTKDDTGIHQKALMERDSAQDISSMLSECTDEISPECYGKSSEEDEIVEIIYTTSSSEEEEEISNGENPKGLSTTGESLNSTRFSQISGVTKGCIPGDSMALVSDSGLNNLNSDRNQPFSPKKPKLRRSVARTNLLAKFDDTVKKDRNDYECVHDDADVNTLIQLETVNPHSIH